MFPSPSAAFRGVQRQSRVASHYQLEAGRFSASSCGATSYRPDAVGERGSDSVGSVPAVASGYGNKP